jgi:hypothetical protein
VDEHVDRSQYPTRLGRLHEPDDESYVLGLSAGERLAMVWRLTLDAWGFKDGVTNEPRLRRDVVHIERPGR